MLEAAQGASQLLLQLNLLAKPPSAHGAVLTRGPRRYVLTTCRLSFLLLVCFPVNCLWSVGNAL